MTFFLKKTKDDILANTKLDPNWLSLWHLSASTSLIDRYRLCMNLHISKSVTQILLNWLTADWLWILAGLWSLILTLLFPLIKCLYLWFVSSTSLLLLHCILMYGVSGCFEWVNGVTICVWWIECSIVMDPCVYKCVWKDSTRCVCDRQTQNMQEPLFVELPFLMGK